MSLADAIRVLNEKVPPVPLPGNQREPLQASNGAGFPEVPPVPSEKTNVQSVAHELADGDQPGNDIELANDAKPIMVEAWTPAGTMMMVPADSAEHAVWIERMNPPPIPALMVRCDGCSNATITNGIARCGAGVESGLAIGGFWATDRHLCESYWGIAP